MSFLETALDAPILWIGAMPPHLPDAADAAFLEKKPAKNLIPWLF